MEDQISFVSSLTPQKLDTEIIQELDQPKQKFMPSKIIKKQISKDNRINYDQLLKEKVNSKNVPKMFGNYFYQYLLKICRHKPKQLPLLLQQFISKREQQKQSNYTISDFQEICFDGQSQKILKQFLEKALIINLIQSNKVEKPSSYIGIIEFYQAASQDPDQLTCNRAVNFR